MRSSEAPRTSGGWCVIPSRSGHLDSEDVTRARDEPYARWHGLCSPDVIREHGHDHMVMITSPDLTCPVLSILVSRSNMGADLIKLSSPAKQIHLMLSNDDGLSGPYPLKQLLSSHLPLAVR